ncbi:anaphase promoting complex subunit 8 [Lentinula guzmanii]|uniref:Anaphase promoting complex subunit 8 n=1 Tax=Lentinula guzmanii TaxID=2804957 RepID=A0AA38JHA3_9AGAR|nr:anaphase promoting complex subunit 8 [Lentinula guzmanii]
MAFNKDVVQDLRSSIRECTNRGLTHAAKWSSELLLSIPASKRQPQQYAKRQTTFSTSTPARSRSPRPSLSFVGQSSVPTRHPHAPSLAPFDYGSDELNAEEEDSLATARICFEAKEYSRVSAFLVGCVGSAARFLSLYSRFLLSENSAISEWHKLNATRHQPTEPINDAIQELLQDVVNENDPFLLFLKAIFLSRLARREEAIEAAILSIAGFPWNWSSWTLLTSCIQDGEELTALLPLLPLPPTHLLVQMFQIRTLNELQSPTENEIALCDRLLGSENYPGSLWLMIQRATALYHLHDFEQAEAQFDRIFALDPYRIDGIDILSNILYVTNNRLKLTRLANEFLAVDKNRPEVCCLVGNHYSLRGEHVKAIKYFRRATQLDRSYLSAWTLMGHEYVEIKNSHAAIEAYRRAVNINRRDYRAWYGLGQAYELLIARVCAALLSVRNGFEIERSSGVPQACSYPADPHEITINLMLARIHRNLDEHAEAVAYHRRVVEVCRSDLRPVQDYAKSSLEVAAYQLKIPSGDLALAEEYLERVAASNAEDVARAVEMLKAVRIAIDAAGKYNKALMPDYVIAEYIIPPPM